MQLSYFLPEKPTFLGSPSTGQGSFNECIGNDDIKMDAEAMHTALTDVASRRANRSTGWTSSEDEADAMLHDDEGHILSMI